MVCSLNSLQGQQLHLPPTAAADSQSDSPARQPSLGCHQSYTMQDNTGKEMSSLHCMFLRYSLLPALLSVREHTYT